MARMESGGPGDHEKFKSGKEAVHLICADLRAADSGVYCEYRRSDGDGPADRDLLRRAVYRKQQRGYRQCEF